MLEPTLTAPLSATDAVDLMLRWPADEPLAALVSGGGASANNAWTILARPTECVVIDGALGDDEALGELARLLDRTPRPRVDAIQRGPSRTPPFAGGWIVALGYGLGRCFEPRAVAPMRHAPLPHAAFLWCEDAWCLDHSDGTLHAVGAPPALDERGVAAPWSLRELSADTTDSHYAAGVARVVEYVRAGDAFQANVARRFSGRITGNLRSFAHRAIGLNRAWFGASIEVPASRGHSGSHLVSMSPELFLRVSPDGTTVTRPIKGTRPSSVDARELADSEKDTAELAMIVDLMRNDLGRVAEIGSVRVADPRSLETHGTVHHGVAEISCQLRADASWLDLLRATFPPGSVTGAPKIRAMQIIDELEPHARGFYCGGIGFISRSGHLGLNVAIRTAQIGVDPAADGSRALSYHAGCGIVAGSEPWSEVDETHAKARALAQMVGL